MANLSICCCFANSSITPTISQFNTINFNKGNDPLRFQRFITSAAKSGGFSLKSGIKRPLILRIAPYEVRRMRRSRCKCPGCKGTGKNKKNGNIFERWKCFDRQGFGLKSCPVCGKGGLTPEQRGER